MLASLQWIREWVKVSASDQEIADRLSMSGLEIEALRPLGKGLSHVFTATLLQTEPHPHADRLTLCQVRGPDGVVSVVCGATNMKPGDRVALAVPGAHLPNGMVIKKAKIRQVESHGMLCSESELGLAASSQGILILDPAIPEALPIAQALGLEDTLLEVNVTPNRGDCLSMLGLAREIAAHFRLPLETKRLSSVGSVSASLAAPQVFVEASESCWRYSCRVIRGVKVGPSPQALRRRLESCGIRSINNVVDATNYLMLETGQPIHAFDLHQVKGERLVIRHAYPQETMQTLDGEERKLVIEDLVIADTQRVLALAGVMGGKDSGVENSTCDLLLESACFRPATVRKSAQRLALKTESSYRFERGVDPNACVDVLERLTSLIVSLAGAEAVGPISDHYPKPLMASKIILRRSRIYKVLGVDPDPTLWIPQLEGLGLQLKKVDVEIKDQVWEVEVPTFRGDLLREIDLIEEVARLFGYENIPVSYPSVSIQNLPVRSAPHEVLLERLRERLTALGFAETLHYSFTSPELLAQFGLSADAGSFLLNPLSEDLSVLRPALFPQMVQTLQKNIFRGRENLRFFELRPVYSPHVEAHLGLKESWHLCLGMSGSSPEPHFSQKTRDVDCLDLKGVMEACFYDLSSRPMREVMSYINFLHPRRQFRYEQRDSGEVAWGGELHPRTRMAWDLKGTVVLAEINLDLFLTESKNSIQFEEISPFPRIDRDLNLIVEESIQQVKVMELLRREGGDWVREVSLLDLYRGEPLPPGKKALTYRLQYGALDRTLTDEEVNQARERLLQKLNQEIGATLR